MVDLSEYIDDIRKYVNESIINSKSPEEMFLEEIKKYGLIINGYIEKDKIVRVDTVDDKKGRESGWYIYSEFPSSYDPSSIYGVGSYGSWKLGDKNSFQSVAQSSFNNKERDYYLAKIERMKQQREDEQLRIYAEKSIYATNIWQDCEAANTHEYLTNKKIKAADGLKVSNNGDLIIPVCYDKQITSLQFIKADGSKKFLGGGRIKGCYFKIKGDNNVIFITEGYATGASINEATGFSVYVCFNAGNIYEVSSFVTNKNPNSKIIIAGDNDKFNEVNVGAKKSTQAAEGLGIEVILPSFEEKYDDRRPTDFNDYANIYGKEALKKYLFKEKNKVYKKDNKEKGIIIPPEGILRDIFNYYNATSGNEQKGFAVQTALALCSVVCSRTFKTEADNFTSLFFLNIAKSGTGKEHTKNLIEKILLASGASYLIGGDGYTSQGGLFTGLLLSPRHITIIDEFGRYLEAANNKNNTSHKEVNTKLMEVFGRCNSIIRPQTYSTMTLKEDNRGVFKDRFIYNPAITLIGLSTPSTFFNNITSTAVFDGFLNRFLISISDTPQEIRKHKANLEVPEIIIDWVKRILSRCDNKKTAPNEQPKQIVINFSSEALQKQEDFQIELLDKRKALEKILLDEMLNRSNEIAMRISLITALARDADTNIITGNDMQFSIDYVRSCLDKTIDELKINVSGSDYERQKKEILKALRELSPEGVTYSKMFKTPPFSKYSRKVLKEVITDLVESELLLETLEDNKGKGRPCLKYFAA